MDRNRNISRKQLPYRSYSYEVVRSERVVEHFCDDATSPGGHRWVDLHRGGRDGRGVRGGVCGVCGADGEKGEEERDIVSG